jgi:hypothetical protein
MSVAANSRYFSKCLMKCTRDISANVWCSELAIFQQMSDAVNARYFSNVWCSERTIFQQMSDAVNARYFNKCLMQWTHHISVLSTNFLLLKASLKAPNVSVRFISPDNRRLYPKRCFVYVACLFICKGAVSTTYFGYFMIFKGCELKVVRGTS